VSRSVSLGDLAELLVAERASGVLDHVLRPDGHLVDCPKCGPVPCTWCDFAVVTPELLVRVDLLHDAIVLEDFTPTISWMLASAMVASTDRGAIPRGLRGSAECLLRALDAVVAGHQRTLQLALQHAGSAGTGLVRDVEHVAGLRTAMHFGADRNLWGPMARGHQPVAAADGLPHDVLDAIAAQLVRPITTPSEGFPHLSSVPDVHALVQPLPSPFSSTITTGSLAELSLYARRAEVAESAAMLAGSFRSHSDRVAVDAVRPVRFLHRVALTTVWKCEVVNWVQTFIDLTGAEAWRGTGSMLRVPWFVAADLRRAQAIGAPAALTY